MRLLNLHMFRNNKKVFNYNFNYKMFLKRNKFNKVSFKNKQKYKEFQLKKRDYKILGKYQIKYI